MRSLTETEETLMVLHLEIDQITCPLPLRNSELFVFMSVLYELLRSLHVFNAME